MGKVSYLYKQSRYSSGEKLIQYDLFSWIEGLGGAETQPLGKAKDCDVHFITSHFCFS